MVGCVGVWVGGWVNILSALCGQLILVQFQEGLPLWLVLVTLDHFCAGLPPYPLLYPSIMMMHCPHLIGDAVHSASSTCCWALISVEELPKAVA